MLEHQVSIMDNKLKNNIIKIYVMVFCRSTLIVAAIFVPLLERYGLTMAQILQTQSIFALTIAITEVPSGYLADLWGRKNTLVLGAAISALAFTLLINADSFVEFCVYEILLGVGMSLNSGADLAILYDTQTYLNRRNGNVDNGKPIARLFSMDGLAGAAGAIAAAILTLWSLQAVILAQVLVGLITMIIAASLVEPPREISLAGHGENFARIGRAINKEPLVLITAIAMITFGLAAIYVFWIYQKYWQEQGVPLTCFGYLWALHCLIRGGAAHYAHAVEDRLGTRNALILISVLSIVGILGMACGEGITGILFALILPVSRGFSSVIFADALNKRLTAEFRATLNSLVSLGFRAIFIVTAPVLGFMIDRYGVHSGLFALAGVFAPAYGLILYILFAALRNKSPEPESQVTVAGK